MSERRYQLSQEANEDPNIQKLSRMIGDGDLTGADGTIWWTEGQGYKFQFSEEEMLESPYLTNLFESRFFAGLSNAQKSEILRASQIDETYQWGLGVPANESDALIDSPMGAGVKLAASQIDSLVLSGAVGYDLAGVKSVDKLARKIESDPMRRHILVGGVALKSNEVWIDKDFRHYDVDDAGGLIHRTWVGASLHGDFRTIRQRVFGKSAIDPIGREQIFAPSDTIQVGAYHSSETVVLRALLEYQVVYGGRDNHELHNAIATRLDSQSIERLSVMDMMYADFGDGDGRTDAIWLRAALEVPNNRIGRDLESIFVNPGHNLELRLVARDNGVEFIMAPSGAEDPATSFLLPKEEISDYIALLMSTEKGRTSTTALRTILDALVTTDEPSR